MQPHEMRLAKALTESQSQTASMEVIEGGIVAPLTGLVPGTSGAIGTFDGGAYYPDSKVCTRALHIKNGLRNVPAALDLAAITGQVPGSWLYGGMLKNEHFGHFLAESLARLWPLATLDPETVGVVFYVRDARLRPVPGWAQQVLDAIRPGLRLHIVSQPTRFESLIVPDQVAHPVIGFVYGHPVVRRLLAKVHQPRRWLPERLYVSRSNLSHNEGAILAERVLEQNLEAAGYTVIHPQDMSVVHQLDAYSSARDLIFGEGSAMHLYALAARPGQRVFVVRRREMSIVFDWQLATFGVEVSGTPAFSRLLTPEVDGGSRMRAKAVLDFAALREQLRATGFIGDDSLWEAPAEAAISRELEAIEKSLRVRLVEQPLL